MGGLGKNPFRGEGMDIFWNYTMYQRGTICIMVILLQFFGLNSAYITTKHKVLLEYQDGQKMLKEFWKGDHIVLNMIVLVNFY